MKTMSYSEFEEAYTPLQNVISDGEGFNGCLYGTRDDDYAHVLQQPLTQVWTWILTTDSKPYVIAGRYFYNAGGYILTAKPHGNEAIVKL